MSEKLAAILADLRHFPAKQGVPQADMPEAHITFLEIWQGEKTVAQMQMQGACGALGRVHDNQALDAPVLQTAEIIAASGFAPRVKAVVAASAPVEFARPDPPAQGADAGYLSPDGPVGGTQQMRRSAPAAGFGSAEGEDLDDAASGFQVVALSTDHAAMPPVRADEEADDPALHRPVSQAPRSGAMGAGDSPAQWMPDSADTDTPDVTPRDVGAEGALAGPPDLRLGQGHDRYARGKPVHAPVDGAHLPKADGVEEVKAVTPPQAKARAPLEGPQGRDGDVAGQPERAADTPVLTGPKAQAPLFAPPQKAEQSTQAHEGDGLAVPRPGTDDAGVAQKTGSGLAPYRAVFPVPAPEATGAVPLLAFGQTGYAARLPHGVTPEQPTGAHGGALAASIAGFFPAQGELALSPLDRPSSEYPMPNSGSAQIAETLLVKTHGALGDRLAPTVWAQVTDGMRNATQRRFQIQLAPAELGKVQISLNTTEAGMQVVITAERAETLDLMRKFAPDFEKSLRDMGYQHLDLSFSRGQNSGRHAQAGGAREGASPPVDSLLAPAPLIRMQHGNGGKGMDIRV